MSKAQAHDTEDAAFEQWAARLEGELGTDDVDAEAYRRHYEAGLSPADAVLRDRMDADVI